jgi:8-oxo-dGTP pyrophosphatase MutT (NUDIX family)
VAPWRLVSEDVLLDAEAFDVCVLSVMSPDGILLRRHVVRHTGTVAVIALDGEDRLALVRLYRPALDAFRWEVPAGRVEDTTADGLTADAARELAEEIGVRAADLVPVYSFYNAAGHSDHLTTVFLATDLAPVPSGRRTHEEQDLRVAWVPLREAWARIGEDGPPDAKSVVALHLAAAAARGGRP